MTHCPSCAEPTEAGDRFCGACGHPLAENARTCACGGPLGDVDEDGFCRSCGRRHAPNDRQDLEIDADFAAVTDRGRKHARNEDAVGIANIAKGGVLHHILIVSDGVSTSLRPDEASQLAVDTMQAALAELIDQGFSPRDALKGAGRRAQNAVAGMAGPNVDRPPAATLVAAIVTNAAAPKITIAWAGDSRAYLIAPHAQLLTRDDSWANEAIASGKMTEAQAMAHKYAHAITQCLGKLPDTETLNIHVEEHDLPDAAAVLLCSDGLWNYAGDATALRSVSTIGAIAPSALAACRKLVAFANAAGGQDNITAAIVRLKTPAP